MASSYYATGKSFDLKAFRRAILGALGTNDSVWRPLSQTKKLTVGNNWVVLVEGSARGVAIEKLNDAESGGEKIGIGRLASPRDWELAMAILQLAADHGAEITDTSKVAVSIESLGEEGHREERIAEERTLLKSGDTLRCGLFQIPLSEGLLALGNKELVEDLVLRVHRYANAHVATLMVLTSDDGKHEILSADYRQRATLIPEDATHITFGARGGALIEGVVEIGHFRDVFGTLIEDLGDYMYVPPVDFTEEKIFFKTLKENAMHAEKALETAPKAVPHPDRKPIDAAQWKVLETAPALIFLGVATSDGKVSRRETTTFAKFVVDAAEHLEAECPSLGVSLRASLDRLPTLIERIEREDDFDPEDELREIQRVIDGCLQEDEARNFKLGLLHLAREIAEASGGFFGFGRRIKKGEQDALLTLVDILGVGERLD